MINSLLKSSLAFTALLTMEFIPPTPEQAHRAIGMTDGLPQTLKRSLKPNKDFKPIPGPKAGDWLAQHPEPGQTYEDYVEAKPDRPNRRRNKIYLQPVGEFPEGKSAPVEMLQDYADAYFMMDVKVLPTLPVSATELTTRVNPLTRNRQILSLDVLYSLKRRIPDDAFCVLALTMEDLYPEPSWNFVFGQVSPRDRVGVCSFARYDPAFYGKGRGENYPVLLLRRSCRVLAHEIAHIFSLDHCIFFKCVMNGSNHLKESDSRPLSVCPVCLRKLWFSIGFDFVERYRKLLLFYQKAGFDRETTWVSKRLKTVLGDEKGR